MLRAIVTRVVVCTETTGFPILDSFGAFTLSTDSLFATEPDWKTGDTLWAIIAVAL